MFIGKRLSCIKNKKGGLAKMRVDKNKLLSFIRANGAVTFEDIETFFNDSNFNYKGISGVILKQSKLAVWNGWNRKAIRCFIELVNEGKIILEQTGMAKAPIPPYFRDKKRLSEMNYIPVIIKAR